MSKVSACIVTYNEESNIQRCLEGLEWADEIIVVDAQSGDRTVQLCQKYTDNVFSHTWLGHVRQKNLALSKASGDWILCLDADERVTPELAEEMKLSVLTSDCNGYYIPRKTYYLGRWINHSNWYPDYKLRLIRRGKGEWKGIDPHDRLEVTGKTGYLKGDILHYSYENISHHLKKINSYTSIMASESKRRGKKFSYLDLFLRPPLKFIKMYVIKGGFMDGFPGFIIAVLGSYYVFLKYAKWWELEKQRMSRGRHI